MHVEEESSISLKAHREDDKKILDTLHPSEIAYRDWVSFTGFTEWSSYGKFSRTSQSRDHCLWVSSSREITVSKDSHCSQGMSQNEDGAKCYGLSTKVYRTRAKH